MIPYVHRFCSIAKFDDKVVLYSACLKIPIHRYVLMHFIDDGKWPLSLASSRPPWKRIHTHVITIGFNSISGIRYYATKCASYSPPQSQSMPQLTHVTSSGAAHMVPISSKPITSRTAVAVCSIYFSDLTALSLIRSNQLKKGDVLGVARIAGIMAAKKTTDLIPLCHPIGITHVSVELDIIDAHSEDDGQGKQRHSVPWQGTGQGDAYVFHTRVSPTSRASRKASEEETERMLGRIDITATVSCDGKTGVEMEALLAASTSALTVYDMCKAVDRGMRIEGLRVVRKEGGKSGLWVEGVKEDDHKRHAEE